MLLFLFFDIFWRQDKTFQTSRNQRPARAQEKFIGEAIATLGKVARRSMRPCQVSMPAAARFSERSLL